MTTRRLEPGPIVVASHNPGKVREIEELLAPFGLAPVSAASLGLAEPEETGATFRANAELKARASAEAAGLPALADDSGLAVEALDGAPGIHSARWAGRPHDFAAAMARVERELQRAGATRGDDRRARFVCALAVAWPKGACVTFEGTVEGRILWPPRGDHGFGYDPIFVPDGYDRTFAEMEPAAKQEISHRARAFKALVEACLR